MPKIYFYNRQSSDKQTLKNGETMMQRFMERKKLSFKNFVRVEEQASAFKISYQKRKLGIEILSVIKKEDILLVTEISRISRRLSNLLHFIENEVQQIGFKLIIMNNDMVIDNTPVSKLILSVMGMIYEMEAHNLSERTKIGIERARKEGKQIGRPKTNKAKRKLDNNKDDIINLLKMDVKKKTIAKTYNVTPLTLRNFIKKNNLCNKQIKE